MVENGTVDLTEWDHSTRTVYKPIKYKINHLDIKQPLNDKFNSMYSYKVKKGMVELAFWVQIFQFFGCTPN